jgi:hypothetical protein
MRKVTIQGAHILVQKGRFQGRLQTKEARHPAILRLFFQPMRCIAFKKKA